MSGSAADGSLARGAGSGVLNQLVHSTSTAVGGLEILLAGRRDVAFSGRAAAISVLNLVVDGSQLNVRKLRIVLEVPDHVALVEICESLDVDGVGLEVLVVRAPAELVEDLVHLGWFDFEN